MIIESDWLTKNLFFNNSNLDFCIFCIADIKGPIYCLITKAVVKFEIVSNPKPNIPSSFVAEILSERYAALYCIPPASLSINENHLSAFDEE